MTRAGTAWSRSHDTFAKALIDMWIVESAAPAESSRHFHAGSNRTYMLLFGLQICGRLQSVAMLIKIR